HHLQSDLGQREVAAQVPRVRCILRHRTPLGPPQRAGPKKCSTSGPPCGGTVRPPPRKSISHSWFFSRSRRRPEYREKSFPSREKRKTDALRRQPLAPKKF